jgi:membrane fusion protein (multidrug efflux system)
MLKDDVLERGELARHEIESAELAPTFNDEQEFQSPAQDTPAHHPAWQDEPVAKGPAQGLETVPPSPVDVEAEQPQAAGQPRKSLLRRRPVVSAIGAVLLASVLGGGYLYADYAGHFESTDDAFIAARQTALAPKVSGYLTEVPVTDNEHVSAGQVIARIDDRDYRVALEQAEAQVAAAEAGIENIDAQLEVQQAQINANQAQVDQAQAALVFAQQQADRYQHLEKTGYGTVQNSEQYTSQLHQQQAALQSAQATSNLAERQLGALKAQRKSAVASLAQAKALRDQAKLNLSYTTVTAAQAGRVANLSAAIGQFAQPGTNLTMFVPDQIWVTANFKEIQLDRMRPGEPVTLKIDGYPGRVIRGHVDSIQPGSGTAFSLLPAQNATGNYVKIVQRVPVKIVMDNPPKDVALGPGMSVVPVVRVDAVPSLVERLGRFL